jgi:hypothetical protein
MRWNKKQHREEQQKDGILTFTKCKVRNTQKETCWNNFVAEERKNLHEQNFLDISLGKKEEMHKKWKISVITIRNMIL